jgi:hypothetical protein
MRKKHLLFYSVQSTLVHYNLMETMLAEFTCTRVWNISIFKRDKICIRRIMFDVRRRQYRFFVSYDGVL